jgi:uridylate kinase
MKRILLKISGEQLAGGKQHGFDVGLAKWIAEEIKKAYAGGDVEIAVVVGGGNIVRGANFADTEIKPETAHYMGMMSININTIALGDIFNANGLSTVVSSRLPAADILPAFSAEGALAAMADGKLVIIGGGSGIPFRTSDTAAAEAAVMLDCDLIAKATKVDGVYSDDPMENHDAQRFDHLTLAEALANDDIRVMDKSALELAAEQQIPIVVFELLRDGNIAAVTRGESVGTRID